MIGYNVSRTVTQCRLKMHDDTVKILDCMYGHDLWKNLISFGTLMKYGLNYFGENDRINVRKGALLMMNNKLQQGIHFLQG